MVDWKEAFLGAIMIIVLSVLFGFIHGLVESDSSGTVMMMVLGIVASLLGV